MYQTLQGAEEAADRLADGLTPQVPMGERLSQGISVQLARYLCAIGAGYADWEDLERRIGTPQAPAALTSEEMLVRFSQEASELIWDHPVGIEALLHSDEYVYSDPERWLETTLALSHLAQDDISRIEAAEVLFDYIRLASDPKIDDVSLATSLALKFGREVDRAHLLSMQETLSGHEERSAVIRVLELLIPNGEDDRARLALLARAARIDPLVADMGIEQLSKILAISLRHIAEAGGATTSGHIMARLAKLRPARGNWRDHWRDQIRPPPR